MSQFLNSTSFLSQQSFWSDIVSPLIKPFILLLCLWELLHLEAVSGVLKFNIFLMSTFFLEGHHFSLDQAIHHSSLHSKINSSSSCVSSSQNHHLSQVSYLSGWTSLRLWSSQTFFSMQSTYNFSAVSLIQHLIKPVIFLLFRNAAYLMLLQLFFFYFKFQLTCSNLLQSDIQQALLE